MGKYIILTVLSVALGITLLSQQGMQTELDTSQSQANRQGQVLARQIARSAFQMGKSELKRNTWRGNRENVAHEEGSFAGGSFDLVLKGAPNDPDSLVAVGRHEAGTAAYRITAEAVKDVSGFNAFNMKGSLESARSGRGSQPFFSGLNGGQGPDQHAMKLTNASAANEVRREFPDDQVVGAGGTNDVVTDDLGFNTGTLRQEIRDADQTVGSIGGRRSVGSEDDPAVVKEEGDLTLDGNIDGVGVLYAEGDLTMKGNAEWDGMVFVDGSGSGGDDDDGSGDDDDGGGDDDDDSGDDDEGRGGGSSSSFTMKGNADIDGSLIMNADDSGSGDDDDSGSGDDDDSGSGDDDDSGSGDDGDSDNPGMSLDVRGNASTQYNSDKLSILKDILPTVDNAIRIRVIGREGRFVESADL